MKLLHVADLHLDRSFEGITEIPEWLQETASQANEKVWQRIVQHAIEAEVDVLVLAGDTFHQTQASLNMQRIFFSGLQELGEKNIQAVICFGNHDYYRPSRFWFPFPGNVTVFTEEAVETKCLTLASGETAAFSAFSYQSPWISTPKANEFPDRGEADYHIGIYHGEIGNNSQYAPFQIRELMKKGYDYWALGHIHKGAELFERGYYAGTPQGHSQKEEEGTGILEVELTPGNVKVERISTAEIFWQTKIVSLLAVSSIAEVYPFLDSQLVLDGRPMVFLKLRLEDYEHLGEEFIHRVASGEFLSAYSRKVASISGNRIFLWQAELIPDSRPDTSLIPKDLLEQTLRIYQSPEVFREIMQDLLEQPEIAGMLDMEDFKEQVLQRAEKLLDHPVES